MCKSLLVLHCNYGYISYHFGDKASCWPKIAIFHTPCIRYPVRGVPVKYCHAISCGRTRIVWLLDGVKSLRICLAILIE